MEKIPDRQAEVDRYLWNLYHHPRISRKAKLVIGALAVAILAIAVGFRELLGIVIDVFIVAIIAGIGFWFGFEYGKYRGEAEERKQMLEEGYSLGGPDSPDTDEDVKPLRTCKRCGHIIDGGDN